MWDVFKNIMDGCWDIWQIKFYVGDFYFTFFDVAVVAVGVWVGSLIWTGIIEGD